MNRPVARGRCAKRTAQNRTEGSLYDSFILFFFFLASSPSLFFATA